MAASITVPKTIVSKYTGCLADPENPETPENPENGRCDLTNPDNPEKSLFS